MVINRRHRSGTIVRDSFCPAGLLVPRLMTLSSRETLLPMCGLLTELWSYFHACSDLQAMICSDRAVKGSLVCGRKRF